jgi:translation initiation factor 3 subunit M
LSEFVAAYNLVVHLVHQSGSADIFLPKLCQNLSAPITSSPNNGTGLALNVLSTIFNTLSPDQDSRYHVLLAILKIVRNNSTFDQLTPQLAHLDSWLETWDMDDADARKLYLAVSDVATEASEDKQAYEYLLKALRTTQSPASAASSEEAKSLSIRALKQALASPTHFDFNDLTQLDSIHALRNSNPLFFELLEIVNSQVLDDLSDFTSANPDFLSQNSIDASTLERKMRLLTLATLAAQASSTRTLPYASIAKGLHIPASDVEMWAIDAVRVGLVEGKLSQQDQVFLIHRATYRVFGDNQWKEVASRLDMWRASLQGVLRVVRQEKENFVREREAGENGEGQQQQQQQHQKGYAGRAGNHNNNNKQYRSAAAAVEVE